MARIPDDLFYTEEHEYLKATDEEGVFQVGVTDYAQGELGDIVFLELPSAGDTFSRMDTFGTIEAVKAVSDLYAPVTGEIIAANDALDDDPSLVNSDPYGAGWMVRIRVTDPSELDALLGADAYRELVGEG
jgi:glycine cleavage system H protein